MYDNFTLSGVQRGYGQSGKKLLPRDASMCQFGRSNRERRQAIAREKKYNEKRERDDFQNLGGHPHPAEAKVVRTRRTLSTRKAKLVERVFEEMTKGDYRDEFYKAAFMILGNAQWRYFEALENDRNCRLAEYADEKLLSYARG